MAKPTAAGHNPSVTYGDTSPYTGEATAPRLWGDSSGQGPAPAFVILSEQRESKPEGGVRENAPGARFHKASHENKEK